MSWWCDISFLLFAPRCVCSASFTHFFCLSFTPPPPLFASALWNMILAKYILYIFKTISAENFFSEPAWYLCCERRMVEFPRTLAAHTASESPCGWPPFYFHVEWRRKLHRGVLLQAALCNSAPTFYLMQELFSVLPFRSLLYGDWILHVCEPRSWRNSFPQVVRVHNAVWIEQKNVFFCCEEKTLRWK